MPNELKYNMLYATICVKGLVEPCNGIQYRYTYRSENCRSQKVDRLLYAVMKGKINAFRTLMCCQILKVFTSLFYTEYI